MDNNIKKSKDWASLVSELKDAAKHKGITHQDIADNTGLQRSNVTRLLGANFCPNTDTLIKVADSIGYTLALKAV